MKNKKMLAQLNQTNAEIASMDQSNVKRWEKVSENPNRLMNIVGDARRQAIVEQSTVLHSIMKEQGTPYLVASQCVLDSMFEAIAKVFGEQEANLRFVQARKNFKGQQSITRNAEEKIKCVTNE